MVAAQTVCREEILAHVAPAVSQRTIGNRLLVAGLRSCVPLALLPPTPRHRQAQQSTGGRNGTLLSSVMGVGSICVRVMDVHAYRVDLVSVIFRSAFAHDTQILPQVSWCRGVISYNFRSHLLFPQGKVNSTHYIAQIVNPVLLPTGKWCPHIAAATQHVLRGVQQLPWPARSPDLSPIEHAWDTM